MVGEVIVFTGLALAATQGAASAPNQLVPPPTCRAAGAQAEAGPAISPADWMTDLDAMSQMPTSALRGRRVAARDARVERNDTVGNGFWVSAPTGDCWIYVVPAEGRLIHVAVGDRVDLMGEFRVPARSRDVQAAAAPFVYAYIVRQAPQP